VGIHAIGYFLEVTSFKVLAFKCRLQAILEKDKTNNINDFFHGFTAEHLLRR
jgi:hypothetical protein